MEWTHWDCYIGIVSLSHLMHSFTKDMHYCTTFLGIKQAYISHYTIYFLNRLD